MLCAYYPNELMGDPLAARTKSADLEEYFCWWSVVTFRRSAWAEKDDAPD